MDLPQELLAELADVRAFAFDVDGTLAGADHHVSERSLRAVAALHEAGIAPVVVTGRIVQAATKILMDAGVDGFAVASGGAVAADTRSPGLLRVATMDPAEVTAVVELALASGVEPILFTATEMVVAEPSVAYDYLVAVNPEAPTLRVAVADLPVASTTKAMLFGHAEDIDALTGTVRERFPRMVRSMDHVWEMSAAGADKWAALSAVLDRLGVPAARTAGVGDGENDLSWLSRIGLPIAMGNARAPVKALARLEIGHHGDDAVARLVEDLLAARERRPTSA